MTGITYGNTATGTFLYDNRYRLSEINILHPASGILHLTYGHDYNSNITAITNNSDATKNKGYSYDALDRLKTATSDPSLWGSLEWTYDGVGNRQTQTEGASSSTYAYQAGTNKLTGISGAQTASFTYDPNGNTDTENTAKDYIYNQNQRLIQVNDGTTTADYVYNGNGQRVKKVVNGITTVFHYSLSGQLIAESDAGGTVTAEYVYLNGNPLAKIEGANVYYYHNDHLGTPQKMTDSTGAVVWEGEFKPFGEAISVTGTVTNNLRFPGQYFDEETGLHYNYFRDYNPVIGRYIQADPIGLRGGINLYRYARANPLYWIDLWGLVDCVRGGTVTRADWQDPDDHSYGLGFRVTVTTHDGSYDQYGHMDPDTTPAVGTVLNTGDDMGDYASPTNGSSSGPHVHYESRDDHGNIIDPGDVEPIPGGRTTTPFGQVDTWHPDGHQGIDMVN